MARQAGRVTAGNGAGGGRTSVCMADNMNERDAKNSRNRFTVESGGKRGPYNHDDQPDQWLKREMQAAFAALYLDDDDANVAPSIYAAAEGYGWPWRGLEKAVRRAKRGNMKREKVKALVATLDRFVDRVYDEEKRA